MESYDPLEPPQPAEWLELDEGERMLYVQEAHDEDEFEDDGALRAHAVVHAVVETQLASRSEEVCDALARLLAAGLDRHEAVHAIGSVLAKHLHRLLEGHKPWPGESADDEYRRDVRELTAQRWLKQDL